MKILMVSASYKPAFIYGGPTMSVSKLSEQLVDSGELVEVICTTANGAEELPVQAGIKTIVDGVEVRYFKRLTGDHSHLSPTLYVYLWKNASKNTLVHIQAWWNLVSVFGCLVAILRGAKTIISARGTLSQYSFNNRTSLPKKLFHYLLGRPLLKRCHFHVTSEKEKLDILKLFTPKSVTVIPNFVRLPDDYGIKIPHREISAGVLKLLFFSRVEEKKGLELLFESLSKFKAEWILTIGGSGEKTYLERLKDLSRQLNIAHKIQWVGHVNNDAKFKVIKDHDLMVLPSHDENFANVVVECLAMGTSVLLSKNVGLADYVAKNELGWICERTQDALTNTLNYISNHKEKLIEISQNAPRIIFRDFNENSIIKLYHRLYRAVETY